MSIHLPPLRERLDDIPLLVESFLREFSKDTGSPFKTLSAGALEMLARHAWPGNIRELRSVIRKAALLSDDSLISEADIELDAPIDVAAHQTYKEAMAAWTRDYLTRIITQSRGNIAKAVALSGLQRSEFYRKLQQYRIKIRDFRSLLLPALLSLC